MKYLMFMGLKEPWEETIKKMFEIEKKRIKNGENWGEEQILPIYNIITTGKSFMVVDTDDPVKLAKYRNDYGGVLDIEIHMIQEFSKLRELYE